MKFVKAKAARAFMWSGFFAARVASQAARPIHVRVAGSMPTQQQDQALMLGMRRPEDGSQTRRAKRSWTRREQQAILRCCLPFEDAMQTSIALAGFSDRENYERGNCFFKSMKHLCFGLAAELRRLVAMRVTKFGAPAWVQASLSNPHCATCIAQVQWTVQAMSAASQFFCKVGCL